ncbi:MAG: GPW/gp25 family protein [Myxococcaceae bacterium]|nr:GPW/gp25 family protein [Myxococcaceae bacterium]
MNLKYPFQVDPRGRTTDTASEEEHLKDLIEQVLFSSPGERVNRPNFGSGLSQLLFAPNNEALVSATQVSVQASLLQWLGDRIQVEGVEVESDDAKVRVTVQYVIRRSQQRQVVSFARGG